MKEHLATLLVITASTLVYMSAEAIAAEKSLPDTGFGVNKDQPVLLTAENMGYDTTNRKVIAKGKVEIVQGETILMAHQVEYDENTGVVVATGDVAVMEPSGNVYFADQVTLKDEMQQGVVAYFKGRLADGSIFTANEAQRRSESVTDLFQAIYTPCAIVCKDKTPKRPTWAVTADKANINTDAQKVTYDDVWVEVYGQKMLYTPYLSHPTPGADNKSGFLTPTLKQDENLGTVFEVPYLYVMDQDQDLTITPVYLSKDAPVLKGEYRLKYDRGEMNWRGSFTIPKDRDTTGSVVAGRTYRGHVDARGLYDLDSNWQTGFTLKRTTDDTYLSRYKINEIESLLTSRAYLEGANPLNNGNDRHYFTTQGLYFQGLTAQDNRLRTPIVLPLTEFGYTTNPMFWNSRLSMDSSMMLLTRDNGTDSKRLATRINWNLPYTTTGGQIFELDTTLRADAYRTNDLLLSNGREFNGTRGRLVPEISATWRYPFINQLESSHVVVEPIANVTITSNNINSEKIPNEDNVLPEFNDLNLFSRNRFSGWDRLESGTRMFYGLRTMWDFFENRQLSASLGQSYRLNNDPLFPLTNDLRSHFSDYVGQVAATYKPFTLNYRFRLDRDNLQPQRTEVESGFNLDRYGLYLTYLKLNRDPFLGSSEEAVLSNYLRLTDVWTISGFTRRDLGRSRLTNAGVGLQFSNECTTLVMGLSRDLISDRDIRQSTTGYMQLILKNLD
jgi:LPS-assembly protein